MNKNVDLNIGIKAVGDFESPMQKFNGLTEESIQVVGQFGKNLRAIGNQKGSISKLKTLRTETAKLSQQKQEATAKVKALHQQINSGVKPTKSLIRNYQSATKKLDRLTEKHKASRKEMASRLSLLKREGVDTRNLSKEQERLGAAYAKTSAKAKAFGDVQRRVHEANTRFDNMSQRAANAALIGGAVSRGGRGLLNTVNAPTQSAIGFEDAMTEVDKFVKGANLPELSKQIRDLGGSSPIGSIGIASLVAAGGKINLNAEQSLRFAEISEKQAVAYGIAVDEAANTITKIRTGMNLTMDEIRDLGDAINYLGDNSGSNAPNINNIVSRIGAVGKASGLANHEIAGLAAIIDSAAPNAETAATSMKNILTAMTGGEQLSGRQKDLLDRLGFDPQDLAASMQENASKTIEDVLKAIAGEDAEDRNGIINGLFGRESQAAVANMVGNLGEYGKVMNSVSDRSKYAGSSQKEYERELEKTSTQVKIQRQQWENVKIQLGEKLLPVLGSIMQTLTPVISGISRFIEQHPALAKWSIIVAGGLGVAAIAIAPVVTGLYAMGVAAAWFAKQSAAATAAQAASGMLGGGGGKRGRGMGRFLKGSGVLAAGLGAISIGSILTDNQLTGDQKLNQTASTGGGIAGSLAGAKGGGMLGATIGTMVFPGVGTAIGGALGGLVGGALGFAGGSWLGDWLTKPSTPDEVIPGHEAVSTAKNKTVASKGGDYIDNSNTTLEVHTTADAEETSNLVIKKLAGQKRRQQRQSKKGGQLYDTTGAVPA
jgi:TP901 family phage tail tape measure protein